MAFKLTAEMLNAMCNKGYNVKEMANEVSNLAGEKVSVNKIKFACEHYKINLRSKPRKSNIELDPAPITENTSSNTNVAVMDLVEESSTVGSLEGVL